MRILPLVAFFATSTPALLAAGVDCDFYVSQATGSDGNDGCTTNSPFKTIDAALSAATNGQTIGVLAGSYAYPSFYSQADYSRGAPKNVSLVAVDGSDATFIDASLVAEPKNARIVGCADHMGSLFDGFTFRGCRPSSSANRFSPYFYAHFRNCVFERLDATNQNAATTWCSCVLDGCLIRNVRIAGIGGGDAPTPSLDNPTLFRGCTVLNCIIGFESGSSSLSLSCGSLFANCFVSCGPLRSLDISPGYGFFDCTLIVSSLQYPNGWSDCGWYDAEYVWHVNKPAPMDGCLVGIDGYTNTYFVSDTFATNRSDGAALIDPGTLRVADTNLLAYYFGYGARADRLEMRANALPRTLTWNGGAAGRLSDGPWSGGAGLHTAPCAGDTLVFPSGGAFENDIGGLALGGLVFGAADAVSIAGGQISLLDGGSGVSVTAAGAVSVEAPLTFGSSPTSTIPVSVCAGGSLELFAAAGDADVLFAGPGAVELHTAVSCSGAFTLSNAVTVTFKDGFGWPAKRLAIVDGESGPSRLVLGVDLFCETMTINGSLQTGRRTYGSSLSAATMKDDAHFGGTGTIYVRHPIRFSIAIW